jgi:hypothetical protein
MTAAFKELYAKKVADQLSRKKITHNLLEKRITENGGRDMFLPLLVGGNTSVRAGFETSAFQSAGTQALIRAQVPTKFMWGGIQLSDPSIEAARSNLMAIKSTIDVQVQGVLKDVEQDIGRQTYGNGTGMLATVTALPVGGITFSGALSGKFLQLAAGQTKTMQSFDPTGVAPNFTALTLTASLTATGVTYSNAEQTAGTITVVSNAGVLVGDILTFGGVVTPATLAYAEVSGGLNGAIGGLDQGGVIQFGLSTYLGVSQTAAPIWQAIVQNNAGGPLTQAMLQDAFSAVDRTSGEDVDLLCTTFAVRDGYLSTLQSNRRYMTNDYVGGWKALMYEGGAGEVPFYADQHATPGTVYGLTKSHWAIYRMAEIGWMDRDGSMWYRALDNTPGYEAKVRYYWEIGCDQRNANFRIDLNP